MLNLILLTTKPPEPEPDDELRDEAFRREWRIIAFLLVLLFAGAAVLAVYIIRNLHTPAPDFGGRPLALLAWILTPGAPTSHVRAVLRGLHNARRRAAARGDSRGVRRLRRVIGQQREFLISGPKSKAEGRAREPEQPESPNLSRQAEEGCQP